MVRTDQSRTAAPPRGWADPTPPPAPRDRWRRALPLLLWMGCLTLAVALLVTLGQGRLAAPTLTDPGSWRAWAAGRDPLEVTMVVLRLLALGCAWYLTGVTSISVVARVLRAVRLVRLADALSVGPIRHLVQQAVGISLAAGVLATAVPAPAATTRAAVGARDADVAVMTAVVDDTGQMARSLADGASLQQVDATGASPAASRAAVMVPVPALDDVAAEGDAVEAEAAEDVAAESSGDDAGTDPDAVAPETTPEAGAAAGSADGLREVRIQPGDHFWALAEQAVAEHLGRPGTEGEVVAHWEAILVANADRLVAAGNPDLLVPGQLVVLPPVEEVGR